MAQKYAAYDLTGAIVAYYDSIDSPVPAGLPVLEITEAEWLLCIATPSYTVVDGALVAPAAKTDAELLVGAQSAKNSNLSVECAAAIKAGFTSNALGSQYAYPSGLTDQSNHITVSNCSTGGLLWCESGGTWSLIEHSQAQAQAVVASFGEWLNRCQSQLVALTATVDAAKTVDAVEAILWASP